MYQVVNFYKFVALSTDELTALREDLLLAAARLSLLGTILLAPEGMNAAIAGHPGDVWQFVALLRGDARFADVEPKASSAETQPFHRLFVKIKPWIIRFAEAEDPSVPEILAGKRLEPQALRRLLSERPEDVVLVDTRNDYETAYGSFDGAALLPIKKFTDFGPAFVEAYGDSRDKTFVFFCTGGIRCEKAAPWAVTQGFPNAYQLDGGILSYFKECGAAGFEGRCFVFDDRWAVDDGLKEFPLQPQP